MSFKKIITLLLCIVIPLAIGFVSGIISAAGVTDWYMNVQKPSFNPPSWVFGPVWTVLYILMGISIYLTLQQPASKLRNTALVLQTVQLSLNFWWSIIFFAMENPALALLEIILLWLSILVLIIVTWRVKRVAAYLLLPYLAWVNFAAILNASIWILNS